MHATFRPRFRLPKPRQRLIWGALALVLAAGWAIERPLTAPLSPRLEIADLTWVEVRTAVAHGFTTALVPSGGLEQNGPHMIIGKHDHIVQAAAREIAQRLGRTLVTPVVSYVPQGGYDPPSGNMRFPGTLGVPEEVFAGTLEGIARSLKAAGFTTICFIADHGGSAKQQAEVARRLTEQWRSERVRVLDVNAYYDADAAQRLWLIAQGESAGAIGRHAGIQDTSELLAVRPQGVDLARFADVGLRSEDSGVSGDPLRASAERGRALLALKVEAAVAQIGAALKQGAESAAR
jgi:creatinine amidohydrolase/Fe(II)-dependent formamide hydrolase-like protein